MARTGKQGIDMITNDELIYTEQLTKQLLKSLKDTHKEFFNGDRYLYSSSNRAKFKRLRIELAKHLLIVEKELYK